MVAVAKDEEVDFAVTFGCGTSYSLTAFFERYAGIAPHSDEVILPYTVEVSE